jgi:phospholipase/carboxylesterase
MKNLPLTHIFIPSKVPSKKLMIILHGRGDTSAGFSFLPPYLNMENMNYLLLDAPYDYYDGFSWYDLPPNQLEGIAYSRSLLTDTLDMLFEEEFNAHESFLLGFSQGSLLTFEFGARYKKVLAGYIAISGYIYDTQNLLEEMNQNVKTSHWLCTHGMDDEVLPYEMSKTQIETLQQGGFDIDFRTYDKTHTIVEDELKMLLAWIKSIKTTASNHFSKI